jgi:hypothetical protein
VTSVTQCATADWAHSNLCAANSSSTVGGGRLARNALMG